MILPCLVVQRGELVSIPPEENVLICRCVLITRRLVESQLDCSLQVDR